LTVSCVTAQFENLLGFSFDLFDCCGYFGVCLANLDGCCKFELYKFGRSLVLTKFKGILVLAKFGLANNL
jgi:hypothetical protein